MQIGLSLALGAIRASGPSEPAAPVIASVTISPEALRVGDTATASVSWTGYPRTGVTWQWTLDDANITDATDEDYSTAAVGPLRAVVSIDNGEGTATATSDPVTVLPALAAPAFTTPASITPASGPVGTVFTLSEGVATGVPAPTLMGVLTLTNPENPDGIDVTPVGLSYTSTLKGSLAYNVTASGTAPDATSTASATVTEGIAISPDGTGFVVTGDPGAATHVQIEVTEPVGYAGTYDVLLTDLDATPVNLVPATFTGTTELGDVVTAVDGLWISSGGGLTTTRQWLRGEGETVVGTGATYTITTDDISEGLKLRESAADGNGAAAPVTVDVVVVSFTPATIQFRDSQLIVSSDYDDSRTFGPSATYTTQGAVAFRFTPRAGTPNSSIFVSPPYTFYIGTIFNGNLRIRTGSLYGAANYESAYPTDTPISFLVTWDGTGGLSGGKSCIIYAKIGAGAWGELLSSSTTSATVNSPFFSLGQSGAAAGFNVDLDHWLWAHDAAISDPATSYSIFFNADGSVKDLGPDGTAGGVLPAPKLYMRGNDFSAMTNSGIGSDPEQSALRTPIVVVP